MSAASERPPRAAAPATPAVGTARSRTRPAQDRRRPQRLLEGSGYTAVKMAGDAFAAFAGVAIAQRLTPLKPAEAAVLWLLPLLVLAACSIRGLYRPRVRTMVLDQVGPIIGALSVASMLMLALLVVVGDDPSVPRAAVIAWGASIATVGAGRGALALLQRRARALGIIGKPTLIVGAGRVGQQVARRLEEHPEYGLRPVGFLDAQPPPAALGRARRDAPVLGTPDELEHWVAVTGCEHVILAFSNAPDRGLTSLVRQCEALHLEISLVPRLFESITDRVALERLGGLPLLGLRAIDPKGWQFRIKYAVDRAAAAIALLVAGPLLLAVAAGVRLSSPGPVLFRQTRVGRDGQVFDLLKFRSMRVPDPDAEHFVPREGAAPGGVEGIDRRTRLGTFIRRTSLDELPQLLNVLRGEMSLIGPRPERPEFVELFRQDIDRYADRHRVKSGITGWAQVHGLRGQTSLSDRVEWDNFYIENWSLWLDFKIVLLTFGTLFKPAE